jgi:proteasome lid subunit RPN8/RPN11
MVAGLQDTALEVYPAANTEEGERARVRYLMDGHDQLLIMNDMSDRGWDLLAIFHSHPHSSAYPSQTDIQCAQRSGYHEPWYIIVSLADREQPVVRAFHIAEDGEVRETTIDDSPVAADLWTRLHPAASVAEKTSPG